MEPRPPTEQTHEGFEECGVKLTDQGRVAWRRSSKQPPRKWGVWSKCYTAVVVIWLEAFTTAISSAGTATSKEAAKEYGTSATVGILCFITVYMIGQALGSLFLTPISELFGRRTIYIIGALAFGLASVITGVPHSLAAATMGRFIQGIAAAMPATMAFANFHDLYDANTRVSVVYSYTLFGMVGLALGPVYSSYVTALLGWRWVYHISAIVSAISAIAACFIRESNADQLLQANTTELRKLSGETTLQADSDSQGASVKDNSIKTFIQSQVFRPFNLLITEPLITLCAILCSFAFSLLYASTVSLPIIYTTPPFNNTFTTPPKASLPFLAILLGSLLTILTRVYDRLNLSDLRRSRQRITPESKLYSLLLTCPLLAIGLWILAWTVPPRVTTAPWPLSMLGLACIGFAATDFSHVLFGYVTDAYQHGTLGHDGHAAASAASSSAIAAISLARTLAAAVFPLFVTAMYEGVGNNFATTIIAVSATACCVALWLLIEEGAALRERSRWAVKGEGCLWEENAHLRGDAAAAGSSDGDGNGNGNGNGPGAVEMGAGTGPGPRRDSDEETIYMSAPSAKSSTHGGTRGSTRLSLRPGDKQKAEGEGSLKENTTWEESKGAITGTFTGVRV